MEIKAELIYPYSEQEKVDFIFKQNHNLGYEIREVERDYNKVNIIEDYENKEISQECEIPDYEEEDVISYIEVNDYDEEGLWVGSHVEEIKETQQVQVGTHTEIITQIEKVLVGTHEEIEVIKVIDIQAWGYTEEEIEEKEKERIKSLTCTKRVFALMLKELGISYIQLKELIASNEDAQLEWELASTLLRSNPLIDVFGEKLGLSSEQIDKLFLFANGEITIEEFKDENI